MDLRGWRNADLAKHINRHERTVSHAFVVGRADVDTAQAIVQAFKSTPEIDGMAELLTPYEEAVNGS